ncbi:MAG: hypothetical protein ABIQ90_05100 [Polaromonas sp.]
MRIAKQVLRPDRLRVVPEQFSWVDHALVQHGLIDRLDARACSLYLFLVSVADAQGLSYYGGATLAKRLRLSELELQGARVQLINFELIAYQAPLYQVLSLGSAPAHKPPCKATSASSNPPPRHACAAPLSLAQLIDMERSRARL